MSGLNEKEADQLIRLRIVKLSSYILQAKIKKKLGSLWFEWQGEFKA